MIIFIKKIKTKEGINSIDMEKIKKDIPDDYKITGVEPMISITANHVVVAFQCRQENKPAPKPNAKSKVKAKSKKIVEM